MGGSDAPKATKVRITRGLSSIQVGQRVCLNNEGLLASGLILLLLRGRPWANSSADFFFTQLYSKPVRISVPRR
jgi:hypothetical protein